MKIYVSGSIYGGTQKIETYKKMIELLENYGEVVDKQIADPNTIANEAFQTDEEIFGDLEKLLNKADLVFAEVSVPSLGVGYEIGYADSHNKKIIGIYDKTVTPKVSTMLRGNKRLKIIPYTDINEIITNLESIIKEEN